VEDAGVERDDELMSIGRFAHISGLSIHALRHYDEVGLLPPAAIDPKTRYRRYRRSQVPTARVIQGLRRVELPIGEIRRVLSDEDGAVTKNVLATHRHHLEEKRGRLASRVAELDHFIERGITMAPTTNAQPVQLKIAVDDIDAAVAFYQKAFGFHYDVTRRTSNAEYSSFVFGEYGRNDFFLLHLLANPEQADRLGPSTFGLLVDSLEEAHQRALDAGATEFVAPHNADGMPRNSAVGDPSGNWVWLYQR
jgi:DNA-binding transcriptional MerR regulator